MIPPRRWLILAIISSALLLIVIDMTVLYTALPTLTRELATRQPSPVGLDDWRCTDRFVQHHHAQRARR
jgi:hypothetical protein